MKEFSKGGKQTEARAEVVSVSALSETRGHRLDPTPIPREYFTLPKSLHIGTTHAKQKFFEERCQPSIPLTCLPFRRKFIGSMSLKNKSAIIVKQFERINIGILSNKLQQQEARTIRCKVISWGLPHPLPLSSIHRAF